MHTQKPKDSRRSLRKLTAFGAVFLGLAGAAGAAFYRYELHKNAESSSTNEAAVATPAGTRQVPVYRLECGTTADGKAVVLGRSYSRSAMEALARKTAVEAKVTTPDACTIKESYAIVPTGPRHATGRSPRESLPLKAPGSINR